VTAVIDGGVPAEPQASPGEVERALAAIAADRNQLRMALERIASYAAGTATKQMIGTTARRALDNSQSGAPQPAPELVHVTTLGLDACATPGAVYTTHITDAGLTAEVNFGRNLNLDTDSAEELETAVHVGLELALAPHFGYVPDSTPIGEWADPENPVTGRTPGGAAAFELAAIEQLQADLREAQHAARVRAEVVTDMLTVFRPSGSGMTARVGQVQIAKWRDRAGLPS
jgi:hypothetical protein